MIRADSPLLAERTVVLLQLTCLRLLGQHLADFISCSSSGRMGDFGGTGRKVKLVINADDLGYNQERDRGIFESFEDGRVTSASVLANGIFGAQALRRAIEIGLHVGLHFNITEGRPLSEPGCLPSLARDGLFMGKLGFWDAVKKNSINEREVAMELQAQIRWFTDISGAPPVHVDGHQHVHTLLPVTTSFCRTLKQHDIKWTRLPQQDQYFDEYSDFLKYVVLGSSACERIFSAYSLLHTDSFIGLSTMGSKMSVERLKNILTPLAQNEEACTCELMVHPGYPCLGKGGCGTGPDDFSQSYDRHHEMTVLRSTELGEVLDENDIELVSYKDLQQVQ